MRKFVLNFIFLTTALLFTWYRPMYASFIVPFFFLEYGFFFYYLSLFYFKKKSKRYEVIRPPKREYFEKNSTKLWVYINQIQAFKRLYSFASLYSGARLNFSSIKLRPLIRLVFILALQIPWRLISLFKDILYSDGPGLQWRLESVYTDYHKGIENAKIEFLDDKIYLNYYEIRDLVQHARRANLSQDKCFDLIKLLKVQSRKFRVFEEKEKGDFCFYRTHVTTKEGYYLSKPHPAHDLTSCQLKTNESLLLHATSNQDFTTTESQMRLNPIPGLIKLGAKRPGSVLTYGSDFSQKGFFGKIRKVNIESILHAKEEEINNTLGVELTLDYRSYLNEKYSINNSILSTYMDGHLENYKILLTDLNSGLWDFPLDEVSLKELLKIIHREYNRV